MNAQFAPKTKPIGFPHIHTLSPVSVSEHNEFKPLFDSIMEYNKNQMFPCYLYECVKFSPGLMGLRLQLLKENKSIAFEAFNPPVLGIISNIISNNNKWYFSSYWTELFTCIPPECLTCIPPT